MLLTKWVGSAWQEVSSKIEMIIRPFRKCGISLSIDGAEDDEINVEDYSVDSEEVIDEEA